MMAELSIIGSSEISAGAKIGVYPVLSSWDSTLTYNKTLSPGNQGTVGSNAIDYEVLDMGEERRSFDITELYEGWVNGESNYGVALKLVTGGTLLPSILAAKGPDVYMGLGASEVINYAIREAVIGINGNDTRYFNE